MLSFFPLDVLDEIRDLIESVSEGFLTYSSMKLVHVRTVTLSCMVGFDNNLVQMIIMTKQCLMNKNHLIRSKVYVTVCT